MTSATSTNGKVRKSLAEQIDRLDGILDGLSEGLSDVVCEAVKGAVGVAVQEAVRGVVMELVGNADLLARLGAPAPPPPPAAGPAAAEPVTEAAPPGRLARASAWVCAKVRAGASATAECASGCWRRLQILRAFKGQLALAAGVGLAAGVAAYLAGPWLAALASAAGGFATAVAVQAGLGLRRFLSTALPEG